MNAEEKILATFLDFWNTWAARAKKRETIEELIPFFCPEVSAIGTGFHEVGKDHSMVIKNFEDDLNDWQHPIDLEFFFTRVKVLSDTSGLVEAEANVYLRMQNSPDLHFHLRFTTIFILSEGQWKLTHNHVSIPAQEQDVGEAYPIDALRAKNNRLKQLVEEQTAELKKAKERSEELLYNILPSVVAQELMETGKTVPSRFEEVSILFTDFKEFTNIVATIPARKLVEELNEIFHEFDDIMEEVGVEKIQTIGDGYLAACGLPKEDPDHALKCVIAAQKILLYLDKRNKNSAIKWKVRIGIHSGPITAGVVGKNKITYDLFGDTVNTASRIETAGEEGRINISAYTYYLIKDKLPCEYRGKIKAKGKGELDMYFVSK
ncbi:MAG: adenylate/guanylate cyclase domain-containing protein [Bacteroidia bacterium]|nr:adenylate/guanylate cyclase domain-containing protein [Bacteroidia bacterium]